MASSPSGKVVASPGGLQLTYQDTGSYGTVSSRLLNIYDANGDLVTSTINMGSNLTATISITADQYLTFVCTVNDNVSGSPWITTVNYLAEGIYAQTFLNVMVSSGCGCPQGQFCNLFKAELNLQAAERYALSGLGIPADALITYANIYVNQANVNLL